MRLLLLYRRRWWLLYLAVLLLAAVALWRSATAWQVLPPGKAVIAAGSAQGSYSRLAQRYAEQLERIGMNVEIVYSDTQKGSLERLTGPGDAASIGFAHGIYADAATKVQALAVVGQEPVWIFSRISGSASLGQAKGLRLAAGESSSSSSSSIAARLLLEHAGLHPEQLRFDALSGVAAANALIDGKVDIMVLAAGEDSQTVLQLTRDGAIQLLGTEQAGALAAREPLLRPLLLPQGTI